MLIASIIIVTKDQISFLEKTIPILLRQKIKEQFEIIIVDSSSDNEMKKFAKKMGNIKLVKIPSDNFKFAHAFNLGAKKAIGKYLIRLSGDCIPIGNQWLSEIVKSFEDENVGGVFGKYVISGRVGYTYPNFWSKSRFPDKKVRYSIKIYPFIGTSFLHITLSPKIYEFTGGCCAIRKDIWRKRPFNENLIAGEDAEYSWFLHVIGYDVVYNPNIKVLHEHKVDLASSARAYSGLDKWSLVFDWEILKYWINWSFGNDPYKKFKK